MLRFEMLHWHSLQAKTCTLDARTDGFDLPEASRFS